jgi:hypothetical protein
MEEKFIIVWMVDGETMNLPHSTQAEALHQAEKLLHEHGCDLDCPSSEILRQEAS